MRFQHLLLAAVLAMPAGVLAPSVAHADINGFGNFSGFNVNSNGGSAPTVSGGSIQLTSGGDELRSIFCDTPQNISNFTATFTYSANGQVGNYSGACFVLQNSASGTSALGNESNGGAFGYSGIGNSIGVTLEDTDPNKSGYYTDGNFSGGSPPTSPVNLLSGDPIDMTLTYTGGLLLQESLLDLKTSASYSNTFLLSAPIPTIVGGSTAYVGLTASSNNALNNPLNQTFGNLQFTTSVPEPSTFALLGVGAISLLAYVWKKASFELVAKHSQFGMITVMVEGRTQAGLIVA